ncbi:MAG: hypothetical protein KTR14_11725, partial [Vampirovibrio sp.]|nr:hypothetical protein [Vampirovibrio sp.]
MAIDKAGMTKLAYSRSYQQIAQSNHGSRNYIDSLDMNKPTVTDNSIGVRYETDKEGQLTLTDESEELIYDRLDRVLQ